MCSDERERTRVDEAVDVAPAPMDEASLDDEAATNELGVNATVDETANADATTKKSADVVGLMFAILLLLLYEAGLGCVSSLIEARAPGAY